MNHRFNIYQGKMLTYLGAASIAACAAICIWTPETYLLKKVAEFAVHLVFINMILGMIFLILGQRTLLYISLVSALALCLHLKQNSNEDFMFPKPSSNPQMNVALLNLSSINEGIGPSIDHLIEMDFDVLTFQEVDPYWHEYLQDRIGDSYPYSASLVRIDDHGHVVFSKAPIRSIDTIFGAQIPALAVTLEPIPGLPTLLLSVHPPPALDIYSYDNVRGYLAIVADYLRSSTVPTICAGDFNLVSWSPELRHFKKACTLRNSRRGFNPAQAFQPSNLISRPLQHIYFSEDMTCTSFDELSLNARNFAGVIGQYEFCNPPTVLGSLMN